jgi:hypothetical protein
VWKSLIINAFGSKPSFVRPLPEAGLLALVRLWARDVGLVRLDCAAVIDLFD